jgi:hypothetical protein
MTTRSNNVAEQYGSAMPRALALQRGNITRTSDHFHVAWVLHGRIGTERKALESLGNALFCVATQKAPHGAPCFGLSL